MKISTTVLVGRPLYRIEIGRWRFTFRFGRYRSGIHRQWLGAYSGALPFVMFTALRRTYS